MSDNPLISYTYLILETLLPLVNMNLRLVTILLYNKVNCQIYWSIVKTGGQSGCLPRQVQSWLHQYDSISTSPPAPSLFQLWIHRIFKCSKFHNAFQTQSERYCIRMTSPGWERCFQGIIFISHLFINMEGLCF